MDGLVHDLIFFVLVYLLVFNIYYFILCRKKKVIKITNEMDYLITRFKLNKKKINLKRLSLGVSLINAFIIAFVSFIMINIELMMILRLMIGFVILFILIYAIYEIYGRYLYKKWGMKK